MYFGHFFINHSCHLYKRSSSFSTKSNYPESQSSCWTSLPLQLQPRCHQISPMIASSRHKAKSQHYTSKHYTHPIPPTWFFSVTVSIPQLIHHKGSLFLEGGMTEHVHTKSDESRHHSCWVIPIPYVAKKNAQNNRIFLVKSQKENYFPYSSWYSVIFGIFLRWGWR